MHIFKTTNIKGKDYVEVNQRLLFFRNTPAYAGWSIESDFVDLQPDRCCIKAIIRDADGRIRATGHAHEDRTSSMINKTSYVENCETSAFGRALAALGIGIETSIASANEVQMAIAKQENSQRQTRPCSSLRRPHRRNAQIRLHQVGEEVTRRPAGAVPQRHRPNDPRSIRERHRIHPKPTL